MVQELLAGSVLARSLGIAMPAADTATTFWQAEPSGFAQMGFTIMVVLILGIVALVTAGLALAWLVAAVIRHRRSRRGPRTG